MVPRKRHTPLKQEQIQPDMCDLHMRLEILHQVPFFSGLPESAIVDINARFREKGYAPGETVYFAGDEATRIYVVASGKVKLIRHTPGGQDVVLDMLMPGEFFGSTSLLGDDVYRNTVQAQTLACVLNINADDFHDILQRYPSVAIAALDITAARLKGAFETIQQLSLNPIEHRIAAVLVKLADKFGERQADGLLIQLPLSRQDLADMTGTTPETASRVMSQFQRAGLIRTGRQWVAITDYDQLMAFSRM